MNREETIQLWQQGKDAWNQWAEERLAERKVLEESGTWEAEKDFIGNLQPKNEETKIWMRAATADFSGHQFDENADFSGFLFPGLADFTPIQTEEEGEAKITPVCFAADARFDRAAFEGYAGFGGAAFEGYAGFDRATFKGNAGFDGAAFKGTTSFERAIFHQPSSFQAITVESAFTLAGATFHRLPDFSQSHFNKAPGLDRVTLTRSVEPGGFWSSIVRKTKTDVTTKYRELKRLAIEGHDHEQEQIFFKGELRARRGNDDRWWQWRYWFGIFYELLSDFGRSLFRPLVLLGVVMLGFAYFYLAQHFSAEHARNPAYPTSFSQYAGDQIRSAIGWHTSAQKPDLNAPSAVSCIDGTATTPLAAAFYLSLKKSLLGLVYERSDKLNQVYACLYGTVENYEKKQVPAIPDTVSFWSVFQTLLSALFIFLFLLAVRNHFRIK